VTVQLKKPQNPLRTALPQDEYHRLWQELIPINKHSEIGPRINFSKYKELIDNILSCNLGEMDGHGPENKCTPGTGNNTVFASAAEKEQFLNLSALNSSQAYSLIQFATERYVRSMMQIPSSVPPPTGVHPTVVDYIIREVDAIASAYDSSSTGFLRGRSLVPVELIWSYWHEEGMLVQSMNAIIKRFQNMRNGAADPLANLELDPLRPLSNILWGYIQQLPFRLTVKRRAYEYDHHYGLRIFGKAISDFDPADSRSKFIETFHNLLYKCSIYFKEADDMTINADAFPLLNSLAEVHRQLAEGMHNQYSDLPVTARVEMLIDQYILNRQETWEFLRGRAMVLYDEPWMGPVDCMKNIQGWTKTSISYYHDLATLGENILLTIRFTPWSRINTSAVAGAWATLLRDSIQQYIYSYQAVTGVDLSVDKVNAQRNDISTMPGLLIAQKFQQEQVVRRNR
jgi:hypothetical protein